MSFVIETFAPDLFFSTKLWWPDPITHNEVATDDSAIAFALEDSGLEVEQQKKLWQASRDPGGLDVGLTTCGLSEEELGFVERFRNESLKAMRKVYAGYHPYPQDFQFVGVTGPDDPLALVTKPPVHGEPDAGAFVLPDNLKWHMAKPSEKYHIDPTRTDPYAEARIVRDYLRGLMEETHRQDSALFQASRGTGSIARINGHHAKSAAYLHLNEIIPDGT